MNKIKRFTAIAMAVVCMAAPTMTAMAETKDFNITVGLGQQDTKSKGIGTFYNGYAKPGKYYYMNSSYVLSPSVQVNARGRYTP